MIQILMEVDSRSFRIKEAQIQKPSNPITEKLKNVQRYWFIDWLTTEFKLSSTLYLFPFNANIDSCVVINQTVNVLLIFLIDRLELA